MTIYTAIFGNYEQLKEPVIVTPGWCYICFTDQHFESDIWETVSVPTATDPRREARKYKALFHNYIDDKYSMWLDGSFRITVDLTRFWNQHYGLPFSAPNHPTRHCVYKEISSVLSNGRGGAAKIIEQGEHYRSIGVPANGGVITSGILLRERTQSCIDLCGEWWEETNAWSLRDQVSFCKVSMGKPFTTFKFNYTNNRELIYIQHKKKSTFAV